MKLCVSRSNITYSSQLKSGACRYYLISHCFFFCREYRADLNLSTFWSRAEIWVLIPSLLLNSLAGDPQHHIFSKTARSQFSCKAKITKIEPRSSENEGQTSVITSTKQTKTKQFVRLKWHSWVLFLQNVISSENGEMLTGAKCVEHYSKSTVRWSLYDVIHDANHGAAGAGKF